jgi:hypothetical protein
MPSSFCSCQRKICRAPGAGRCGAPARRVRSAAPRPDERGVAAALRLLKAGSGSHSPSVAEVERAIPGLVEVDACFLSNPYATDAVMQRLRSISPPRLERMVAHYPSHAGAIASLTDVLAQPVARPVAA